MRRAGDPLDRLEDAAARLPVHLFGRNLSRLAVRIVRRFVKVRVTGLAAEMTYYTFLSLLPLLTAIGAGLGLLERFIGTASVDDLEQALVNAVEAVFSEDLVADVVAPMIETLLREERTGVAIGGLAVSIWVASRIFRAAIRALDDAYDVEDRRTLLQQWGLSLAFMAGAVVLVTVSLSFLVIGPLLGGGRQAAEWIGMGEAFEVAWSIGRWPVVVAVSITFLVWLYRVGPNVDNGIRECLPGALLATVILLGIATGFRSYLGVAGPETPDVDAGDEAVLIAIQLLGVLAATLLFVWLSNMAVLLGGVLNAEWARGTADDAPTGPPKPPAGEPGPGEGGADGDGSP